MNLNTKSGSTTTTLASNLAYSGLAGAAGKITTMDFGSGDIYTASYDTALRLTSASLIRASDNSLLYQTQPAYDVANNVIDVQTSVGGATDTQQFCYDWIYRLVWAGTSGTNPCSGTSFSAGTLTTAQYQQSDNYNSDGGLTSGPSGNYTYGDSSHPHAVTSISNGYSAAYDPAGNQTCRALTSATTCSGTQTGQQLSYDNQGRLSTWESQPTSPAQTANYLYDGAGNRVAMQTTVNGTTTLTAYIGNIEETQTTSSITTTTTYYAVQGKRIAANVNGSFFYFGYDALGSQVAVLNSSGNLVGSQLYGPYGNSRYSNGTLPTSIGFTGQRRDSVTGLDYYMARFYDPVAGQFLSADNVQGDIEGMNPYTYVLGNPETYTDPDGQAATGGPNQPKRKPPLTPQQKILIILIILGGLQNLIAGDAANQTPVDGSQSSGTEVGPPTPADTAPDGDALSTLATPPAKPVDDGEEGGDSVNGKIPATKHLPDKNAQRWRRPQNNRKTADQQSTPNIVKGLSGGYNRVANFSRLQAYLQYQQRLNSAPAYTGSPHNSWGYVPEVPSPWDSLYHNPFAQPEVPPSPFILQGAEDFLNAVEGLCAELCGEIP